MRIKINIIPYFLLCEYERVRARLCPQKTQPLNRGLVRGGKNRRALLAGNVKQLHEIRLNEDLLLKI